jgi:hypothetical protein
MSNSSNRREVSQFDEYSDLYGNMIDISSLDDDERRLLEQLQRYSQDHPDIRTGAFWNFYPRLIGEFYDGRGLSRRDTTKTTLWRIAQDIRGRMMIAAGLARRGDYRDELEQLILNRYLSRRAFCEATGLSEDMLSHVFAKRKHLAIDTLSDALAKIGYTIHITQMPEISPPSPT